jgi:hypothetical protein
MAVPAQKSVTIKVRVGADPVDVMAACVSPPRPAAAGVSVNGTAGGVFSCLAAPRLIGLPARPGRQADITFTKITVPFARNAGASWRFAVYEWTPPAMARPAPPVPWLPRSYTGDNTTTGHGKAQLRKIASRSGDWPSDRTAVFTVPFHGRNLDISVVCAGAIADRLQVTMQVNGSPASELPCASWVPGQQPPGNTGFTGQRGKRYTLTFRIKAPSPFTAAAYAKRAASWTIGIYEEEF